MATVELLTSNQAAGRAVRLARVQVIPIYPITPQSAMLGEIARDVQAGRLKCEFINMESDYAAMAAAIGASLGGTRVFTATNSQGLLFMAEHLYTASGSRCPIVMAVVSRGISVPHTRYADHNDALGVNRAGWIQVFCEDAQEVLETCLQLHKVCEDRRVRLPGMFCYESFIHSNTAEGGSHLVGFKAALTRTIENAFTAHQVPYLVLSGVAFYERAEVKDLLAYLKLIVNPRDGIAFNRVVNVPTRGIGKSSLERLQAEADRSGHGKQELC